MLSIPVNYPSFCLRRQMPNLLYFMVSNCFGVEYDSNTTGNCIHCVSNEKVFLLLLFKCSNLENSE